jgi:hypothetical protein
VLADPYTEVRYREVIFVNENLQCFQLVRDGEVCNKFYTTEKQDYQALDGSVYNVVSPDLLTSESIWP